MPDTPESSAAPPGLFIIQGLGIRIPAGGLVISMRPDGTPGMSLQRLEFALDMTALWLQIAFEQLENATAANEQAISASKSDDAQLLADNLRRECNAGMLAIASSAFAFDAFYAALKDRSPRVAKIPLSRGPRGSTRFKMIAEALRREFRMGDNGLKTLRAGLREVFKFRDMAVHPTGAFTLPVVKQEINKLTEWRFVAFGAPSARTAVRVTLAILYQLVDRPRNPSADLRTYLDGLRPVLQELATQWRETYGLLTDTE